ncbi:Plexin-A4 [Holothuria leucospilota]|uniref:Plexin-A4 n=1 Tax=Holothuria leucospilota TaxID=206669 RepID=A0A9Q1CL03_HOLLE|nr:Plexin-A4 [Holothuria leucospilota]
MTEATYLRLKWRSSGCNWSNWKTSLVTKRILYFVLVCSTVPGNAAMQSYPTFQIPDSESQFQTTFLDTRADSIYIGALNNIYKLSSELTLENSLPTGPVQDNQLCRPVPFNCDHERTPTDHHSKVILVHQNRLITCGNIYQGTCDVRDPDSLNVTYGDSIQEVAPNTPAGLAVAFIAHTDGDEVLYVASSYGRWLRDEIPTVSTRLIANTVEESNLFKVSSDNVEIIIPAGTVASSPDDQKFNISYIDGFTSGQFSYFVAFQPSDHTTSSKYISKVVRLCQGDPDFYSYIELPLVCANDSDNDYHLVQSSQLATLSLEGNETKVVLVAAFSKSETEISDIPSSESAVCIYPLEDINRAFYERRINCAQQQTDNTEINWSGSAPCRISQTLVDAVESSGPDGYCHIVDTMHPLGGDNRDVTILSTPVYESNSYITAVAAVQHFETSIIFVGDSDGRLRKLRLDDAMPATEYENLQLHQTPVIRKGLLTSEDKEFVFVISENQMLHGEKKLIVLVKVKGHLVSPWGQTLKTLLTGYFQITKVPVEECHEYQTCEECHAAQDPYCGWCSLQAECTRRIDSECTGSEKGTSPRWLSTDDDCLTIISVTPMYAPAETVTELIVEISSLPPIPSTGSLRCVFREGPTQLGTQPAMMVPLDISNGIKCNTKGDISATSEGFRAVELQIHYEENGQSENIAATNFDFYDCTKLSLCSLCAGNKYECHWCLYSNQCKDSAQTCSNTDISSSSGCDRAALKVRRLNHGNAEVRAVRSPRAYRCRSGNLLDLQRNAMVALERVTKLDEMETRCVGKRESNTRVLFPEYIKLTTSFTLSRHLFNFQIIHWEKVTFSYTCRIDFGGEDQLIIQANVLQSKIECDRTLFNYSSAEESRKGSLQVYWGDFALDMEDHLTVTLYKCDQKAVTVVDGFRQQTCGKCLTIDARYQCGWCPEISSCLSLENAATCPQNQLLSREMSCPNPTIVSEVSIVAHRLPNQVSPLSGHISGGTRVAIGGFNLGLVSGDVKIITVAGADCSSMEFVSSQKGYNSQEIVCRTSSGNITNGRIAVNFDLGCETGGDPFSYREDPIVDSFEKVTSIVSGGLDLPISGDFFDVIQEASMEFRIADETFQTKCNNKSSETKLYCNSPNITLVATSLPYLLPAGNVSLYMDGVTTYTDLGDFFTDTLTEFFIFYSDPIYYQLPSGEDTLKVQSEEQRTRDIIIQIRHGNLLFSVGQIEYQKMFLSSSTLINIILSVVLFLVLLVLVVILVCCCRKAGKGPKVETDSSLIEAKESKVKHSYFSKDSSGNTLQMSLRSGTDDASERIYFGDEMDYMTISSNLENKVMEESETENKALEEDEGETVRQENIVKQDGVTSETVVPLDMIESNETTTDDNENKSHYTREIVDDKVLTNVEDQKEIASEISDQESDAADGSFPGDGTIHVSDETGINPYSDRIYSENRNSDNSQRLSGQSGYSTNIYLDKNKESTKQ